MRRNGLHLVRRPSRALLGPALSADNELNLREEVLLEVGQKEAARWPLSFERCMLEQGLLFRQDTASCCCTRYLVVGASSTPNVQFLHTQYLDD